jgi:predicted transposase YdaD
VIHLEGVQNMHESTTYQAILREGRNEGLIEGREEGRIAGVPPFLVRLGTKRYGKPDSAILAAIEAIRDVERLGALAERITDAEVRDWNGLLGTS